MPGTWSEARFYFEKVADRNTWDFPLVNVAAAMTLDGAGNIEAMRIACGGVQCTPRRLSTVEALVRGRSPDEETAKLAGAAAPRRASTSGCAAHSSPHRRASFRKCTLGRAVPEWDVTVFRYPEVRVRMLRTLDFVAGRDRYRR